MSAAMVAVDCKFRFANHLTQFHDVLHELPPCFPSCAFCAFSWPVVLLYYFLRFLFLAAFPPTTFLAFLAGLAFLTGFFAAFTFSAFLNVFFAAFFAIFFFAAFLAG